MVRIHVSSDDKRHYIDTHVLLFPQFKSDIRNRDSGNVMAVCGIRGAEDGGRGAVTV